MSFHHDAALPTAPTRVVVLGGRGFLGRAIHDRLTREGILMLPLSSAEIDLSEDVAAERLQRLVIDGDAIVFAAGITPEKGRDIDTFMRNIRMARNVAVALAGTACGHLVYISSDSVYPADAPNPVTERTACDPTSLYGLMHLVRERLLQHELSSRMPVAILRPAIIFGPGDTHGSYGPNGFRRSIAAEGAISLFGGGEEYRDHLFVDDFSEVVRQVLFRRSRGVLNVATGQSRTFAAIAESAVQMGGASITIRTVPRTVPLTHRHYDVARLQEAFPDFRSIPFEDALARTFAGLLHTSRMS